ncbi:hypothetical protein QUF44_19135 [Bacillus subtilis]|nr:hypothetical protein [Bacillus subtilis]MDM5303654.1 hypothetical protein [Bacillus subtilis]MDM5325707.1 hypothetical protein [Bacillus subtilis]
MYETIRVGDWVIKADVEETRKQYEKELEDMCGCGNCLNYYEAVNELPVRKSRVLEKVLVLFRRNARILVIMGLKIICTFIFILSLAVL